MSISGKQILEDFLEAFTKGMSKKQLKELERYDTMPFENANPSKSTPLKRNAPSVTKERRTDDAIAGDEYKDTELNTFQNGNSEQKFTPDSSKNEHTDSNESNETWSNLTTLNTSKSGELENENE